MQFANGLIPDKDSTAFKNCDTNPCDNGGKCEINK